jgi:hypothetical protein
LWYSVRAAVFQKVGLKIMKAAAAVGVGEEGALVFLMMMVVVSFCSYGLGRRVVLFLLELDGC